jgi:type II secretory pathway component PulC
MTMRIASALALVLALGACGPRAQPRDPGRDDLDNQAEPAPEPEPAPIEVRRGGEISRAELDRVLDAGPGQFLQVVRVEPSFDGNRFLGWVILAFVPPDRFAGVDLVPGDLVVAVNGQMVARPEQLQAVWEDLRNATEVIIEARRDGAPFELRFQVAPTP